MPSAWRSNSRDCRTLVRKIVSSSRIRQPFFVVEASKRMVSGIFLSTGINETTFLKNLWGPTENIGRLQITSLLPTSTVFEWRGVQRRLRWWTPASNQQAPKAVLAGADGDIEVELFELWQAGVLDEEAAEAAELDDDCAAWQEELEEVESERSSGDSDFPSPMPRRPQPKGENGVLAARLLVSSLGSHAEEHDRRAFAWVASRGLARASDRPSKTPLEK